MNRPTLPPTLVDDEAEHHLAAIATISIGGAVDAAARTGPDVFHDPIAWAVIDAARLIPNRPDLGDSDPIADRIDSADPIDARIIAIAEVAGIYEAELRQWVADTPSMWDPDGHLANRVRAAAARRQRAHELIAELQDLGIVVRWRT